MSFFGTIATRYCYEPKRTEEDTKIFFMFSHLLIDDDTDTSSAEH